jgi:tetratricopeptide (TPR) repeat protein
VSRIEFANLSAFSLIFVAIAEKTNALIRSALTDQDFERAGVIAESALADGESHETLFRLAALKRQEIGDHQGAADMLLGAVELSPHDPAILVAAADALREAGQLEKSITLFDQVLAWDPDMLAACYGRAMALEAIGALEAAEEAYRHVTRLLPNAALGFAGLSRTSAQRGDKAAARRHATRAYEIAPEESAACMALARCEMADDNFEAAVALLRQTRLDQIDTLALLGDALDRLGRFDEAFDAYTQANQRFVTTYQASTAPSVLRDRVEAMTQAVAALQPGDWRSAHVSESNGAKSHVFLLGFPRSGTTLVEQALASLPNVVTTEEMPTLDDASALLTGDGIAKLAILSDEDADSRCAAYWRRVAASGVDVAGKVFIDMDPSKSVGLPAIVRLFPDAKVIIMQRDPRDVVWSCFRRAFGYSAVTAEFTSLERAAAHYAAVRRLTETCIAQLPLNAHTVVYKDLVRDFDATTKAICDFIEIDWSQSMRDFGATARAGRVKTVSADQVRGALFDGAGQWRSYAEKLEPVMPVLEPWIPA